MAVRVEAGTIAEGMDADDRTEDVIPFAGDLLKGRSSPGPVGGA
jgi:hypothetical protein